MEVDKMKEQIKRYQGEQNILEFENRLRDNKRQIVNFLTDNIYILRNGFKGQTRELGKLSGYQEQLMRMVLRRGKKIKIIEMLI